jgi:hypothetical protein
LVGAAWTFGAVGAAFAQPEPLEITLQVLDDVSQIDGVLMPLEEVPAHRTDAASAPALDSPPPAESDEEVDR